MSLKIEEANKSDNCLTIYGQSINNKWYYITNISWSEEKYNENINEGNFVIVIPKNNKYYKITTTLFSNKPSLGFESNINVNKDDFFPYSKYSLPPEVWICVYGSIEAIV